MELMNPCRGVFEGAIGRLPEPDGLSEISRVFVLWNIHHAISNWKYVSWEPGKTAGVGLPGSSFVQLSYISAVTFGSLGPGIQASVAKSNRIFEVATRNQSVSCPFENFKGGIHHILEPSY